MWEIKGYTMLVYVVYIGEILCIQHPSQAYIPDTSICTNRTFKSSSWIFYVDKTFMLIMFNVHSSVIDIGTEHDLSENKCS